MTVLHHLTADVCMVGQASCLPLCAAGCSVLLTQSLIVVIKAHYLPLHVQNKAGRDVPAALFGEKVNEVRLFSHRSSCPIRPSVPQSGRGNPAPTHTLLFPLHTSVPILLSVLCAVHPHYSQPFLLLPHDN